MRARGRTERLFGNALGIAQSAFKFRESVEACPLRAIAKNLLDPIVLYGKIPS